DLMIDFFGDLAGRNVAIAWAEQALRGSAGDIAKKNALRIAARLRREIVDVELTVFEQFPRANLSGRERRGKDLSGQDLRWADLSGADLTEARLVGADLQGATLVKATLARADLTRAKLTGADLRDAMLDGARLLGADLTGAHLEKTWLRVA